MKTFKLDDSEYHTSSELKSVIAFRISRLAQKEVMYLKIERDY